MSFQDKLAERIGSTINELDIDFSRFTLSGWLVSLLSLAFSGAVAYAAYKLVPDAGGRNQGPALVFGLTMIATTVVTFLVCRTVASRLGFPITSMVDQAADHQSTQDTLRRLAAAGVDLERPLPIEFQLVFALRPDAERARQDISSRGFSVDDIDESPQDGGYLLPVRTSLVPHDETIANTERGLSSIAAQYQGRYTGWCTQRM